MLNWANQFNICCFLDNHQYHFSHNSVECLLGAGSLRSVSANAGNAFTQFYSFYKEEKDWAFGHFAYDLKNEIEELQSSNFDGVQFPDLFFFVPEIVIQLKEKEIIIGSINDDHESILNEILNADISWTFSSLPQNPVSSRYSKEEYISVVNKLKEHIRLGDCYEINFCQEFYIENAQINPLDVYESLSNSSPNPFSAYYKLNDKYLLCLSPERYIKKEGNHLISQPIKGTSRRNIDDPVLDEINIKNLQNSEKERAENIMVVDLVRNDLSRICKEGTVKVDELCGIYSFPQVHQMISTVSGELKPGTGLPDIIKATFPMGSMTGAPKRK